ncbi:MAG: aminodeoxychorismate synthase component I [Verrucomicrobia bacterium]|nr:aminodeoxychorismate synthase component I [Verrucomicrobiota bacterium]
MLNVIRPIPTEHTPESLVERLRGEPGVVLLRSALHDPAQARHSYVTARPFLTFTSSGTRCEIRTANASQVQFGNPWHLLDSLLARYELLEEVDVPFPLGGCFGYWGYELKDALESCLTRRAINDLELPDCHLGFHDSLVVFDHALGTASIISTGLRADGSRSERQAQEQFEWWRHQLEGAPSTTTPASPVATGTPPAALNLDSTLTPAGYKAAVLRAQAYIRAGDIYQVNLARRVAADMHPDPWRFFQRVQAVSPAPFAAFLDCGGFQIASSSPESFLRLSGRHIRTRPIKGTRPRGADPEQDTRLAYELQTSAKEQAELVMITDLLRNDLGKVCEFGSVRVPDLFRLERFSHVQHLVSTVEGQLRPEITHLTALAACFPGGSITGAPKIRAMQIIDELEPVTRGPYTGALGYLGFNQESQLSIVIRTAVCTREQVCFHVGAGIVADSDPEMEYEETAAKALGLLAGLALAETPPQGHAPLRSASTRSGASHPTPGAAPS